MAGNRSRRKDKLVRALAIVLAVLLIGTILYSVIPVFGLAEEEAPRSRYALDMAIDLDNQAIAIAETLDYVNTAGRALDCVWLNVYANALRRAESVPVENSDWNDAFPEGYAPGGVDFISVKLNGEAASWAMSGSNEEFMRVECPLEPGGTARIELVFRLLLPVNNWAMGLGDLGWRLVNFYPIVAVYDAQTRDFVLNSWTVAVDPLTSEPADYEASLALPEGWLLASAGEAIPSAPDENGMVAWHITATGARDLSLAFSRKMNERSGATASGLVVRAYANTGSAARAILEAALRVMETYEGFCGACPFAELELMETDCLRGSSKTGLVQIPPGALAKRNDLEETIARLCAKQWFGVEAGCNPENEPWLTDTLAVYASLLFFEEKEGYDGYLKRLNRQVLSALQMTIPGGLTPDSRASRFTTTGEYELVVIDRGAAVLHEMRDLMGREAFIECLARYVADNRGRIASIEQFVNAANEVTGSRWDEYVVNQMMTISDYVNQRMTWFE